MLGMKRGERTRARILDESARLFAELGYTGTAVRQIADAAQVNVAAIAMYFGSKEGLYRTLLDEGFEDLVGRRRAELEACRLDARLELSGILSAFVRPLFQMLDEGGRQAAFLRMLSRTLFEPDPAFLNSSQEQASGVIEEFVALIRGCVPELKPRQVRQRLGFSVGAISQALADPNRPPGPGARRELLRFLVLGFTGRDPV